MRLCSFIAAGVISIGAAGVASSAAGAQQRVRRDPPPKVALEARLDAIISRYTAIHAGLGFTTPLGTYLRSGLDGAIGASENGASGRIEFVNRFHLDPFREKRWAPYAGGGIGARFEADRRTREYLFIIAGLDGPVKRGITTSVEAGLGSGGRIGVIIRRAATERR